MKTTQRLVLILMLSCILIPATFSQKEYMQVSKEEGIEFSYLWKRSKVLKKDSPMILYLKIANSNDYSASVEFTLDYFWNGVRSQSSEPITRCVKAGKTMKGKIRGLTFEKAGYSDQDLNSLSFDLDVSVLNIEQTLKCKKNK